MNREINPQVYARVGGVLYLIMIAGPVFIGETSFAVWLLIKGVRIDRWRSLTSPA